MRLPEAWLVGAFAHMSGAKCAGGGLETALHLAVKEVLSREKRMMLPDVVAKATAKDIRGRIHTGVAKFPARLITFDAVTLEHWMDGIRPDILAYVGESPLLVEVAVTHFVDDAKLRILQERGLSTVELNLSAARHAWTWESVTEAVVKKVANKRWLENSKQARLLAKAQKVATERAEEESQRIREREARDREQEARREEQESLELELLAQEELAAEEARHKLEQEEQRAAEFARAEEERRAKATRDAIRARIEANFQFPQQHPPPVADELERLAQAGPADPWWRWAASLLDIQWDTLPLHLNIEVAGELAFLVHRCVWQCAVFAEIVRTGDDSLTLRPNSFSQELVTEWCLRFFPQRSSRKYADLMSRVSVEYCPSVGQAVQEYLEGLEALEYLESKNGRFWLSTSGRRSYLAPQEPQAAAALCIQAMRRMGVIEIGAWRYFGVSPAYLAGLAAAKNGVAPKLTQVADPHPIQGIDDRYSCMRAASPFWLTHLSVAEPLKATEPEADPNLQPAPFRSRAQIAAAEAAYRRRKG